jgi:hypothetical protein
MSDDRAFEKVFWGKQKEEEKKEDRN